MIPAGHVWGPQVVSPNVDVVSEFGPAAGDSGRPPGGGDVGGDEAPARRRGRPRKSHADGDAAKRSRRCAAASSHLVAATDVRGPQRGGQRDEWAMSIPDTRDAHLSRLRSALLDASDIADMQHWDRCAEVCCGEEPRRVEQLASECERLGYSKNTRGTVRPMITTYGAGVYYCSRLAWSAAVGRIIGLHDAGELDIIVSCVMLSSDETSMETCFRRKRQVFGTSITDAGTLGSKFNTVFVREKQMTKILQSELLAIVAVRWKTAAGLSRDFEVIACEVPCRLISADHMTSPTLQRCWQEILYICPRDVQEALELRALFKVAISMSDRGSNCLCANRISRHLGIGTARYDNAGCALHNLHLATKSLLKPFKEVWSGCTSFGLFQKPAGVDTEFRLALQTALRRRVVPRVATQPPPLSHSTMKYRQSIMDVLMPCAEQRLAFEFYFRGNLQDQQIDVFFEDLDDGADVEAAVRSWSIGASWCIYQGSTGILQSGRWVRNISPLLSLTLLDFCHDIRREAISICLAGMEKDKKSNGQDVRAKYVDGAVVITSAVDDCESIPASALWSALNTQTRMDMKAVAQRNTSLEEMILCIALKPVQDLNAVLFAIDEDDWEVKQQLLSQKGQPRTYRLLEARRGNITRDFWKEADRLMNDASSWQVMGPMTLRTRALCFAAVARLTGSTYYYLDGVWLLSPNTAIQINNTLKRKREIEQGEQQE